MEKEIILKALDLKKDYVIKKKTVFNPNEEVVHAVAGVSFEVEKGETLGVVGESGCGKSTLARLTAQLIKPTGGETYFKGKKLSSLSDKETQEVRRNIQMVFQNPLASLDPRKRIIQLLVEPLEIHSMGTKAEREEKALKMLEEVGLNRSYAYRFPHEFSGGQCQRINIARALMLNPEVLILDEPVSALDVSIQAQVINLLIDLQKQFNLTYIFISHDLNVVRYFCDRIMVMYMGEVVESADSEEIYFNPKHEYTRKLLNAIPGKVRKQVLKKEIEFCE